MHAKLAGTGLFTERKIAKKKEPLGGSWARIVFRNATLGVFRMYVKTHDKSESVLLVVNEVFVIKKNGRRAVIPRVSGPGQ